MREHRSKRSNRTDVRSLERAVMGAPAIPPSRLASWATGLRRGLLGLHRRAAPPPLHIVEALFAGFDAHVLRVLIELGIPDLLEKPTPVTDLAEGIGCDPDRLDRLLRFAAGRGLVGYDRKGRAAPNGVTAALRSDASAPWRGWVRFATAEWFDAAWRNLGPSLAPDAPPAFQLAHGADFFEYTTAIDPDAGRAFDEAMTAGATLQAIALARTLDWADCTSVCDLGGGSGAALDVLQRYEPHLDVTLFELPLVLDRTDFADRVEAESKRHVVAGSFFDEIPSGHDRYLLLAIIHDWDDAQVVTILGNVAAAIGDDGEAVVVETVAAERPRDDFAATSDLLMLVLATGRERTRDEYRRLFDRAGLVAHDETLLPTGATAFTLRRTTPDSQS